jgi:hypothetical protein
LIQQLRSLLRGRGWQPGPKKEQSHFDKVDVESRVLETYRPITDKDIRDADIIMATWWENAEWVAKLSPSKGMKVYFLQHDEAFDYVPKGRVEATWWLPMHKIAVALWLADIARNGVADLRYQRLNMPVIETSIHKASGFSTYLFHTLIKQRPRNQYGDLSVSLVPPTVDTK